MGIRPGFIVDTDNSQRIRNFIAPGHEDEPIQPEAMADHLNGGERLIYRDEEYTIMPSGSLVHISVALPENLLLGSGVMLNAGVTFESGKAPLEKGEAEAEEDQEEPRPVELKDRARVSGSRLYPGVIIGEHTVVLQSHIGSNTELRSYVRVRENVHVGKDVVIGPGAKVDKECSIGDGVKIGAAVKLGYKTTVHAGVTIGELCRVGKPNGTPLTDREKEGIMIAAGRVIPPRTRVTDDVIAI